MYCQDCGVRLPQGSIVCMACGALVDPSLIQRQQLTAAQSKSETVATDTIALGFVLSILIPLIGFIMGIYVLAKNRIGFGIALMVSSLFWSCVWIVVASRL